MGDGDKSVQNVVYLVWEYCKDKRGRLGFHQKFVSSPSDSEAFLKLICLRCKYLRICPNSDYAACVFLGVLCVTSHAAILDLMRDIRKNAHGVFGRGLERLIPAAARF